MVTWTDDPGWMVDQHKKYVGARKQRGLGAEEYFTGPAIKQQLEDLERFRKAELKRDVICIFFSKLARRLGLA